MNRGRPPLGKRDAEHSAPIGDLCSLYRSGNGEDQPVLGRALGGVRDRDTTVSSDRYALRFRLDAPDHGCADGIARAIRNGSRKGLADKGLRAVRGDLEGRDLGRSDRDTLRSGGGKGGRDALVRGNAADDVNAVRGLDLRSVDGERGELKALLRYGAHFDAAAAGDLGL